MPNFVDRHPIDDLLWELDDGALHIDGGNAIAERTSKEDAEDKDIKWTASDHLTPIICVSASRLLSSQASYKSLFR